MAKKQRRFVPRMVLAAACTAQVVPLCALEGCGGKARETASGPDAGRGGAGGNGFGGGFSVALPAFGGQFSVGVQAFGGVFGMAGGAFGVGVQAFGGTLNRGGTGGVPFGVAGATFGGGGYFGMAGGAFSVAAGAFGGGGGASGRPDAGTDSGVRDAGPGDAADGHARLEPGREDRFGELNAAPRKNARAAKRRG